jgi:hypothetical protein
MKWHEGGIGTHDLIYGKFQLLSGSGDTFLKEGVSVKDGA